MVNSAFQKIYKAIFTAVILAVILAALYAYFYVFKSGEVTNNPTVQSGIDAKLFEDISKPADFSSDVLKSEEGYGRPNPFVPYK